jgi:hypothetical protein
MGRDDEVRVKRQESQQKAGKEREKMKTTF